MAQRVGRGIALLFHDRGTRREWVVSSTPMSHYTPGKDPVPILQEAGWAPGPVWTDGKSRPHWDSIPDRPARLSVAIPTELSGPHIFDCILVNSEIWTYNRRRQPFSTSVLTTDHHFLFYKTCCLFVDRSYFYMIFPLSPWVLNLPSTCFPCSTAWIIFDKEHEIWCVSCVTVRGSLFVLFFVSTV